MSIAVPVIDYKALVQDDRIHVSLYTDPRIFADEMDRIFTRGWVFVGHASEIPRSGDYVTRELGSQPVIMVRGKDGGVSVLVNRCMHRGTMLCTAGRGATRTFACPYHGWTYDLDGTLPGVPYPGGYAEFDKSAHGLRHAARVASYRGFVFASFSPTGSSLAALESRDGPEVARRRIMEGPAHALIFPNLFLGETNIAIVQPTGVEECVHWHTPMFWKGVPEFNSRLLRMSEAGMGPASFLMPEDLTVAARNQAGLHAATVEWLELARGFNREVEDAEGRIVSHVTDETINRALWKHYRTVMAVA